MATSLSLTAITTAFDAHLVKVAAYNTALAAVVAKKAEIIAVTFPVEVDADGDYNTPASSLETLYTALDALNATLVTKKAEMRVTELATIAAIASGAGITAGAGQWFEIVADLPSDPTTYFIGYKKESSLAQQVLTYTTTVPTQAFPLV